MAQIETNWTYEQAFVRNLGLLSSVDQEKIKSARIAIAGVGGVGGDHAITLARMGFENFHLAEFDEFDVKNFNRQYGAFVDTVGRPKIEVIQQELLRINPHAKIQVFPKGINPDNIDAFLDKVDVYVDGLDAFEIKMRRTVFQKCYEKKIWAVTAGPLGIGVAWLVVNPKKMSFEEYCGFSDSQDELEQFASFIAGLAPAFLHLPYIDRSKVSMKNRAGPSNIASCKLCAGIVGAEVMKIITGRGKVYALPNYQQFDAFRLAYKRGRVWLGGRNPASILKRKFIVSKLRESQ
jgi:hypothetical protein